VPRALLRPETTAGCECRRRESNTGPQSEEAGIPGASSTEPAPDEKPAGDKSADTGRVDAGLDSVTMADLEELLDIALDAGRLEKARELRDRIKAARGRS
jgi:hypothetical protein